MMRVTNSMIVQRTKTNINNNRAKVDYTNNQMSTQKKITKPSDNPIIAIRSLRLRSTLSTITQYYENNIPDAESWMDCTETALVNMKDLLTDAYESVVYGATDELEPEDREAILKDLKSLQQQIYCEGNTDYARRTVFTGYKTDQSLTFMNNIDAKDEHYKITERFDYLDIDKKNYYANRFDDTSDTTLENEDPGVFEEITLNRLRLSYDLITPDKNSLNISYKDADGDIANINLVPDGEVKVNIKGGSITGSLDANGDLDPIPDPVQPADGQYHIEAPSEGVDAIDEDGNPILDENGDPVSTTYTYNIYTKEDWEEIQGGANAADYTPVETVSLVVTNPGTPNAALSAGVGSANPVSYRVTDTTTLRDDGYVIGENEIVFDRENGELIFGDKVADTFDANRASMEFEYDKQGFVEGELRPEYYFDCTKYTKDKGPIEYVNYDENGEWMTQGIFYNVSSGQQMQINTEARDVFNSDIRRDIVELIDIVSTAITAQTTVDDIKKKMDSGNYDENSKPSLKQLEKWYDAANKQLDYAKQNMHDTYSAYISKFQGYLDDVDLQITDLGGRSERVALTKTRMSVQQSTFKELKSINEDMDLSDLVINYTAASVAYQCALQAAAKIGQMTLLDFIR